MDKEICIELDTPNEAKLASQMLKEALTRYTKIEARGSSVCIIDATGDELFEIEIVSGTYNGIFNKIRASLEHR